MRLWLVTGGAGFIGSHLVHTLVARGERVRVVDNLSTGRRENLSPLLDTIEFIHGDLCEPELCARSVRGVDIILHQAALGSVPRSVAEPLTTHEANVTATLHLLLAARDADVKRIVLASSSSIYGANPLLPKHEDLLPQPLSPYAVSKLAQEKYSLAFHAVYNLDVVALRYFNIYGPRQDPDSVYAAVVPRFIKAALSGQPPVIYGDGGQTRDFTFVEDCVAANLAAAEAEGVAGQVFNIAAGSQVSVNDLWTVIKHATGTPTQPVFASSRPGEVRHSFADTSRAQALLGWKPSVPLHLGIEKTIAWMRSRAS